MSRAERVVIVTGAARGIGQATVKKFLENGYQVIGVDIRDQRDGGVEAEQSSGRYHLYNCDVSNEDQVKNLIDHVMGRHGRIDVLVNVAGVVVVKPLDETSWGDFQRLVNVNLGGTFLMCKHTLPIMREQGDASIINLGSVSGHVGQVDHALYGATKGAIIALGRALAWEVAPYNIRVNSISPGSVDTPMLRSDIEVEARRTGLPYNQVKANRESEQAMHRWADPAEIAEAIYFMASAGASFITGTDLLVDCGWVAK